MSNEDEYAREGCVSDEKPKLIGRRSGKSILSVEPAVRVGLILCGECFDDGDFKTVGVLVGRCFCCGAMCGAAFASEKRQAYHVNGDRSRVRPERRHLLKPVV